MDMLSLFLKVNTRKISRQHFDHHFASTFREIWTQCWLGNEETCGWCIMPGQIENCTTVPPALQMLDHFPVEKPSGNHIIIRATYPFRSGWPIAGWFEMGTVWWSHVISYFHERLKRLVTQWFGKIHCCKIWNNSRSSTCTPYNSPKHLTTPEKQWDQTGVCLKKDEEDLEIHEMDMNMIPIEGTNHWFLCWQIPKNLELPNVEDQGTRLIKLLGILWCYIFELWTIPQSYLEDEVQCQEKNGRSKNIYPGLVWWICHEWCKTYPMLLLYIIIFSFLDFIVLYLFFLLLCIYLCIYFIYLFFIFLFFFWGGALKFPFFAGGLSFIAIKYFRNLGTMFCKNNFLNCIEMQRVWLSHSNGKHIWNQRKLKLRDNIVDVWNLANQLSLVGSLSHYYPIIYDGFYTSQVEQDFFHQQYVIVYHIFSLNFIVSQCEVRGVFFLENIQAHIALSTFHFASIFTSRKYAMKQGKNMGKSTPPNATTLGFQTTVKLWIPGDWWAIVRHDPASTKAP